MTEPRDELRDSLTDLADAVQPADLYDRAIGRSRRIARQEATVGTLAALAVLLVLAAGLWQMPDEDQDEVPAMSLRSSSPALLRPSATMAPYSPRPPAPTHHSATASPAQRRKNHPAVASSTPAPQSRTLADLPGKIFYQQAGSEPDVVRLSPGDGAVQTVLPDAPSPVGISPDGKTIAYAKGGELLITGTGKDLPERVAGGVSTTGQAPAWSPDGARLLVEAGVPAVYQVASGTLVPLAGAPADGRHFRWSGDGSKLVYSTSYCGLRVATAQSDLTVPVIGDRQPADNPDGLAACKPTSVDVTGDRVTVPLQTTGEIGADLAEPGDAVVDTVTGDVVPLPVGGSVVGTVFGPDGNLLVRTRHGGLTRLSVFTPAGKLLVEATEPAAVRDLNLLAYTR